MNYELTQNINNQTEHLRIVEENLQIVNGELGSALKKKKEVFEDLLTVVDALNKTKDELNSVNITLLENKAVADKVIEEAEEYKSKAKEIIKDSENKSLETEKKYKQLEQESMVKLDKINKEINSLFDKKLNLDDTLIELNNKIYLASRESFKKESELSELDKKIKSSEIYIEDLAKKTKETEVHYNNRLSETEKHLELELSKIENPMKALEEKERLLNRKEKNIEILRNRLDTRFKKFFPGQTINI